MGTILLLFSGPRKHAGNLKEQIGLLGMEVEDFDIANGPEYDLVDDAVWDPLLKRIVAGKYLAIFPHRHAVPFQGCAMHQGAHHP